MLFPINGKKEKSDDAKMLRVVRAVSTLLGPEDVAVLEDFAIIGRYRASGKSTERVQLLGMLTHAVFEKTGRLPIRIHPLRLKLFVAGKGRAEKGEVISALCRKFKVVTTNHNLADAAVLAIMGFFLLNPDADSLMIDGIRTDPLDEEQREVLRREAVIHTVRMG